MSRQYGKIYRYVASELLLSFFISFLFFFFLFFVNQILVLAEDILSKKIPFWDVALLIFFSLPAIIALSAPFGSLVGALMTVGRFSSDNEILAMQAVGISLPKIFAPIFFMSLLISLGSFIVNDYLLPVGILNFNKHYKKIVYQMPQLELEAYSAKKIKDSIIVTGEVQGNRISDLLIIDKTENKDNRVIASNNAVLLENEEDSGVLSLQLENVFGLTADKKIRQDYQYFESDKMVYNVLLTELTSSVRNVSPREMSSYDVYQAIQEKALTHKEQLRRQQQAIDRTYLDLQGEYTSLVTKKVNISNVNFNERQLNRKRNSFISERDKDVRDRSLHSWRLEFNQKFSLPFSCVVFAFLAFPIGLFSKRSGRSVGFGIGVFLSLMYWGLLVSGRTLGYRANFSAFWSMWTPNFLMFFLGLCFFALRLKR